MTVTRRRDFVRTLAAGTAATVAAGSLTTAQPRKVKVGLIGCGWWGMVNLNAAYKAGGVETIALCDVDTDNLEKSAVEVTKLQNSRPQTFKNYHDLLNAPGLEAVIIATPPHWHALQFIAACQKGLDIYCEKPIAYDVREIRAMIEAAKKSGRIVQIGFQRRHSETIKQAAEYIRSGQAGRILQVDAQINYSPGLKPRVNTAPLATVDWDMWCGPAPKIPYHSNIVHRLWRHELAYGKGHMIDWGIHWIDAIRFVLGESVPRTANAVGGLYHLGDQMNTPDTLTVHFEFGKCPVVWRHRLWGVEEYAPETNIGMFFYGEQATIFLNDQKMVVMPKGKGQERRVIETNTDTSMLHVGEFLESVRTRKQPSVLIEDAYQSNLTVQLGMLSYLSGAKVTWDAKGENIIGNPAAARMLRRDYRAPYKHPWSAA